MKRFIAVVVVAATMVGGLSLIAPTVAHAATVQANVVPARADTSWHSLSPPSTAHQLAVQAKRSAEASPTPGAASVQLGWFTALLTMNHAEVTSGLVRAFLFGEGATLIYLCGMLPGWIATGVCIFAVAASFGAIMDAMSAAASDVTWHGAWWCPWGDSNPYDCPGLPAGAFYNIFTGLFTYPDRVSGLNILFTWLGIPVAWQINQFTG